MDKYDASITSTKNGTDDIVEKSREMWLRNPTHLLSPQKWILTQITKQRNHKHPQKQLLPLKMIKNDIFDKSEKSRYIPVTNISNKMIQIEKPSEINIHRDNLSVSVLSGQGEILASVTPDQISIPRKIKWNKTTYSLVIRKEPIRFTVNPIKLSQEDTVTNV